MLKTGDILVTEFAYSDKSGLKRRPVVLIENFKDDLLVAYFTREVKRYADETTSVLINKEDISEGSIKSASIIRLHKLALIHEKLCKWVAGIGAKKVDEILRKLATIPIETHFKNVHRASSSFTPGKSYIPYAGRVYDEKEMISLVDSAFDFWLTTGRYAEKFEQEFAAFLGVKHCSLTNSGSSANLLAFMALTSPELGPKRIKRGDEVITVAAGFPTTVAPIIQYGVIPVFVDITLPTYNIDCNQLEAALSEKTKAVMLAHTLGNPFDIARVKSFCDRHNLWLIEDNCDALGSKYRRLDDLMIGSLAAPPSLQHTGTFGHIGTSSFYPPHHMTMGEGGAVYTNDPELKRIIESFRDWGRDCWCVSGRDNTCKKRFNWQLGDLPHGYDHKYIYSHFGYNLKATEMQAAIGCAQLEKLPGFIEARKRNWRLLRDGLDDLQDKFILPEATENSDPSWFGFLLTVKENAGFTRDNIVNHLEANGIQTRMLFAGNIIKHPCFDEMRKTGNGFRIVSSAHPIIQSSNHPTLQPSSLPVTDQVMMNTFWVGVYPGLTEAMIEYIIDTIKKFSGR